MAQITINSDNYLLVELPEGKKKFLAEAVAVANGYEEKIDVDGESIDNQQTAYDYGIDFIHKYIGEEVRKSVEFVKLKELKKNMLLTINSISNELDNEFKDLEIK